MRRTPYLLLALALALLAATPRLAAQEVQVPLDVRGRVDEVDRELARRLGLWLDEYPGFREARLFQGPDSGYVLEITLQQEGRVARQRVPLTPAQAAALRDRIGALLAQRAPAAALDQEGRYLLLGQTTLAGAAFYSWALPYALGVEGTAAASAALATVGASFFVPFVLTQPREITYGMATLSRYGLTRGIAHGLLLHALAAGEEEETQRCLQDMGCYHVDDSDGYERAQAGVALLASVAGGVVGYGMAAGREMSAGTANAIATGGDAGLLGGWGLAYLLDLDGTRRAASALTLAAAAGGMWAGHHIAQQRDYTWGDADVIYTAGATGAWAGSALSNALWRDDRPTVAGALLGAAAGLYLADGLVRDTDFSVGRASLNRLGTLAGGLAGASIGLGSDDETTAWVGSALGAALGFAATYAALAPQSRGEPTLRVQISPTGPLPAGGGRPALRPALGVIARVRF